MKLIGWSALVVLAAVLVLAGCRDKPQPEIPQRDDTIRPVYPAVIDPHPLATRLCDALHETPARRGGATRTLTPECVRQLSGAISFGAISLESGAVETCAKALEAQSAACAPRLPEACRDTIRGTLAQGAGCRSTLECAAPLRCQGVGPTDPGRCLPPLPEGFACGGGVDGLVPLVFRTDLFEERKECEGACDHNRCRAALTDGSACTSDEACGTGSRCEGAVCLKGSRSLASKPAGC